MIYVMIMFWIIISIALVVVAIPPAIKKLKPHEFTWGDVKHLSNLTFRHELPLPDSPFNELEDWWFANESKEARIEELQAQVTSQKTTITNLEWKLEYYNSNAVRLLENNEISDEFEYEIVKKAFIANVQKYTKFPDMTYMTVSGETVKELRSGDYPW